MESMHEKKNMDDTRGVGNDVDLLHTGFEGEQIVELKGQGIEDMHVEYVKIEDTSMVVDKEDDSWDVASLLDEKEPMVEINACMDVCVAKETLRIKDDLEEKKDKSLLNYEVEPSMGLVEKEMYARTHGALREHEYMDKNVTHKIFGEAHQGDVSLEAFTKEIVMVMLFCVAVEYVLQIFFPLNDEKDCIVIPFETM